MNWLSVGRCGVAVGALFVANSELRSQWSSRNPTASDVAVLLRTHGHYGGAVSVLTQERGSQPSEKLDEMADTLAAIAVGFPGTDVRAVSTRSAATAALAIAGMAARGRGVPYAGAADHLMRVAETSVDVGVRAAALLHLTRLSSKSKLLSFLREVATSQSAVAHEALRLLAVETGPDGRSVARELYRNGRITERAAIEVAAGLAHAYGWR